MKTISRVLKKAKHGDVLTDGKRYWLMDKLRNNEKVAMPIKSKIDRSYDHQGFELWEECTLEKIAIIPGLKILKRAK